LAKRIAGNVYWIENGKPTSRVVDASEAFTNPQQAAAQVLFAEAGGDIRKIRLARLAHRFFLGRRFRAPSQSGKKVKKTKAANGKKPAGVKRGRTRKGR
jgi:hypothetical protein